MRGWRPQQGSRTQQTAKTLPALGGMPVSSPTRGFLQGCPRETEVEGSLVLTVGRSRKPGDEQGGAGGFLLLILVLLSDLWDRCTENTGCRRRAQYAPHLPRRLCRVGLSVLRVRNHCRCWAQGQPREPGPWQVGAASSWPPGLQGGPTSPSSIVPGSSKLPTVCHPGPPSSVIWLSSAGVMIKNQKQALRPDHVVALALLEIIEEGRIWPGLSLTL